MPLSINPNDQNCPAGQPVSVTDTDTGQVVGCFKTVIDAYKAKTIMDSSKRAACPCCAPEVCDCSASCEGCDCMRGKRDVSPPMVVLPPTVAW